MRRAGMEADPETGTGAETGCGSGASSPPAQSPTPAAPRRSAVGRVGGAPAVGRRGAGSRRSRARPAAPSRGSSALYPADRRSRGCLAKNAPRRSLSLACFPIKAELVALGKKLSSSFNIPNL